MLYNLNMTKTDKVQAAIKKGVAQINVVELVIMFLPRTLPTYLERYSKLHPVHNIIDFLIAQIPFFFALQ